MKKNMGRTDKVVRVLLAIMVALLVYFEVVQGTFAMILLALATVFVITSVVSFCPLYRIFGLSSCKVGK
ncbi:MAG: DUF2892 domain-containing protein [Bacteroidota bacterium]